MLEVSAAPSKHHNAEPADMIGHGVKEHMRLQDREYDHECLMLTRGSAAAKQCCVGLCWFCWNTVYAGLYVLISPWWLLDDRM